MLGLTKKVDPSIKKKAINIAAIENSLEDENFLMDTKKFLIWKMTMEFFVKN